MPPIRLYLILGAVGALLVAITSYGLYLFHEGENVYQAHQAVAQLKQNQKVQGDYDKIDRETPFGGSDSAVSAFLLSHTRAGE